ncbi:hypothetical protein GGR51DRAFT_537471 [Nemania sp. FL0031]|nr:hypothetical protein GGR51DRAFT_537471 [Nemania sp. FL0031]
MAAQASTMAGGKSNTPDFLSNQGDKYGSRSLRDISQREGPPYNESSVMGAFLATEQVNGVIGPSSNTGVTIHLGLKLYDDLDERLEQLAYLSRLGHFDVARKFYAENLQDRADMLYVRMQYVELLLSQGDYKALEQQNGPIGRYGRKSDDLDLLLSYWNMMRYYAICRKPRERPSRDLISVIKIISAMQKSLKAEDEAMDISSTQIKFLAVATQIVSGHLANREESDLSWKLHDFGDRFSQRIYEFLLRKGRVWDMHDLMISLIPFRGIIHIFDLLFDTTELRDGIRVFISDWTGHIPDVDVSTNLALLGVLTSVIATKTYALRQDQVEVVLQYTLPLATSILETDPKSAKSRPFLRWILEKARLDEAKSTHGVTAHYFRRIRSYMGLGYYPIGSRLPQYAPLEQENPGWNVSEASLSLKEPAQVGLRTAQEMGDYKMQALFLQLLIRVSADPREDFKNLCYLQRVECEDYQGYVDTLVSSYLVTDTGEAVAELSENLSLQLMGNGYWDHLPKDIFFMANYLLRSISAGSSGIAWRDVGISYRDIAKDYEHLATEMRKKIRLDEFAGGYNEDRTQREESPGGNSDLSDDPRYSRKRSQEHMSSSRLKELEHEQEQKRDREQEQEQGAGSAESLQGTRSGSEQRGKEGYGEGQHPQRDKSKDSASEVEDPTDESSLNNPEDGPIIEEVNQEG